MNKQGDPIQHSRQRLFVFTGPRGSGKTTLACEELPPSQIDKMVYVDFENSGNNFREKINRRGKDFGLYINTLERFGHSLPSNDDLLARIDRGDAPWVGGKEQNMFIDFFKYTIAEVNQIPNNKYKTVVFDTGEKLEAGMAAYVEANKRKFGVTDTGYGRLWTVGVYPLYQHILQGLWDRGIDTVILNFHLKNVWEGKRPVPGKVTHAGKKLLYYLSSLMIWLVNDSRNPHKEPAGLVLKERLGDVDINEKEDRWINKTMLPPRIPTCDWDHINDYLKKGYNYANPDPREIPTDAERDMISELLNDIQIRLMLEDMALEREQNTIALAEAGILPTMQEETVTISGDDESGGPKTKAEAIIRWKSVGRPLPELLKKFKERGVTDENLAEHWESMVTGQEE